MTAFVDALCTDLCVLHTFKLASASKAVFRRQSVSPSHSFPGQEHYHLDDYNKHDYHSNAPRAILRHCHAPK